MQKSSKVIDTGQKTVSSRRKSKTAKISIIDVDQTQNFIKHLSEAHLHHEKVCSLMPSVDSMICQMKRIMSIEFPNLDLDDVFVNRSFKRDTSADFQTTPLLVSE